MSDQANDFTHKGLKEGVVEEDEVVTDNAYGAMPTDNTKNQTVVHKEQWGQKNSQSPRDVIGAKRLLFKKRVHIKGRTVVCEFTTNTSCINHVSMFPHILNNQRLF